MTWSVPSTECPFKLGVSFDGHDWNIVHSGGPEGIAMKASLVCLLTLAVAGIAPGGRRYTFVTDLSV